MFIKPIARCSLVACAILAAAFTPQTDPEKGPTDLMVDLTEMSARAGGEQHFQLHAGPDQADRWYLILGSISGTEPGTPIQDILVPLNYDLYTQYTLARPNAGLIRNQVGRLDAAGNAQATFVLPPGIAKDSVGDEVNHAYVVINREGQITKVSNAVSLVLTD